MVSLKMYKEHKLLCCIMIARSTNLITTFSILTAWNHYLDSIILFHEYAPTHQILYIKHVQALCINAPLEQQYGWVLRVLC